MVCKALAVESRAVHRFMEVRAYFHQCYCDVPPLLHVTAVLCSVRERGADERRSAPTTDGLTCAPTTDGLTCASTTTHNSLRSAYTTSVQRTQKPQKEMLSLGEDAYPISISVCPNLLACAPLEAVTISVAELMERVLE